VDVKRVGLAQVLPGTDGDSSSDQLCDRIDEVLSSLANWRNSGGDSECELYENCLPLLKFSLIKRPDMRVFFKISYDKRNAKFSLIKGPNMLFFKFS